MKSLFFSVSIALFIGRSYCQLPVAPATAAQQSQNSTSAVSPSAALGLNTTTNGTVGTSPETNAFNTTSSNSTVALDATSNLEGLNSTSLLTNNSTTSEIFLMNQDIHWSTSNFSIYDQNGDISYQITNQYGSENLTKKEIVVQDGKTGDRKLKIDTRVKLCGFGQKYEADDGTIFRLDPRAFLPDRWYIKYNATEFVYKRGALSLEGNILENERVVAQVSTHKNSSSTAISTRQLTLTSDGTIPPWDLIALLAVVKTRIHTCGY